MEQQTDGPGLQPSDGADATEGIAGTEGIAAAAGELPEVPDERRPVTGEPRVDAALARLDELDARPVTEHRAIFDDVHRRLRDVLGELDTREQPQGAGRTGASGQPRR
jgi:hypothetical protein